MKFYDIDFSDGNMTPARADIMRKYGHGLMSDAHAGQIVDFIMENRDLVRALVCHCDAGISRSAGVGAAAQRILTGADKRIFNDLRYRPNMHVYRKILDNYYNRTGEFIKRGLQLE